MIEKKFTGETWLKALSGLDKQYKVFVPVKDGDFHTFAPLSGNRKPDFGYQNTRMSPKALVYPQSQRMFEYTLDEQDPDANILREPPAESGPQAIVGIRPCDAQAFQLVKCNFDNPEYRDPLWVRRFETTTLVGLGCNEPCATCFCSSVGGGPFDEKALDVILFDLGEGFLARALTEKGEAFLKGAKGGRKPAKKDSEAADALASSAEAKISSRVATDRLKGKRLLGLFEAPFWEEVAFSCINCGTCTFLCPTCWCFDIQDEVLGKQGDRLRNWDSCMFPIFTLHGSGHNPRDKKFQRVRQRFMHKLKYYVDKYGDGVQCSGCGRCVRYCPVNIDIRQVCERMNDY